MLIVEVDLKWTTDPDFECWMIWRLRKQPKEPMHQNWPVFGVGMWTKQESRQIICTFVNFFFFKCWHIYHFLFPIIVPRRRLGMLEEVLMRSVSKLAKMFQQISFPGKGGRSLPPPRSDKKVGKCETGSKFRNWEWQVDQGKGRDDKARRAGTIYAFCAGQGPSEPWGWQANTQIHKWKKHFEGGMRTSFADEAFLLHCTVG